MVFSLFEENPQAAVEENFVEKLMLKGIEKSDVESVINQPATFNDLLKLAIAYSDGVIQNSENVNADLLSFAQEKGIPTLGYQTPETYIEAFKNFYDEVWSKDK